MMLRRWIKFIIIQLIVLILVSCNEETEKAGTTERRAVPEVTGVSVWDRISTKHQPVRNSPTATLLSLGETFLFLDSTAIDSSYKNMKFLKAQLSDSSVVWVYDFASVLHAKTAVITGEVPLYRRPDLMTITEENLEAMEIVAVTEEWDDWVRVVNEKKEREGWIHQEFITYNTVDIAFSLLATRTLKEEEAEVRLTGLEDLLEKNPYPATIFLEEISLRIDREKELMRENAFGSEDWQQYRRDRRTSR